MLPRAPRPGTLKKCMPLLLICLAMASSSVGQVLEDTTSKVVDIDRADQARRLVRNNLPIQELIGNVKLHQEETHLWADRVTRYLSLDQILLIGNVLIVQDSDSLTADSVLYFTGIKQGRARGNVRLSDGEVQVFAPSAIYFTEEKHTIFDENVRLVDSLTVLTSTNGEYFSEEKRAEFFGDVVLEEDRTYLEADSVTYFRDTEISIGFGDVFIERIGEESEDAARDSLTRTFLFGHHAYNDNRNGYSRITGDALLLQLRSDSTGTEIDSLLMKASMMEAIREDSLQRLIAVDSVKIWRQDFSALADSAVYDRISMEERPLFEENRLFNQPKAWFDEYQLSGDTLRATARAGHIDTLKVRQNAFASFQDSTTGKINQLKGQHLIGLFEQDSLKSLTVGPQAESIYYSMNDDTKRLRGTNASGDRIQLFFERDELESIRFYSNVEGKHYDGALIPEPFELEGFLWTPELRPTRDLLMEDRKRIRRLETFLNRTSVPGLVQSPKSSVQGPKSSVQSPKSSVR